MIAINENLFVKNEKELTDTLFNPVNGQTAQGFYKQMKHGIRLYDLQHKLVAFVRLNHDPLIMRARLLGNGKIYYSFASERVKKFVGLVGVRNCDYESRIKKIK